MFGVFLSTVRLEWGFHVSIKNGKGVGHDVLWGLWQRDGPKLVFKGVAIAANQGRLL